MLWHLVAKKPYHQWIHLDQPVITQLSWSIMLGTVYESNPAINDGLETNHIYSNIPTMGHDSFPSCTPTFSSLNWWWRMLPSGSCSSATKILRKLTAWQIEALHLRFLCCNECKSGKKIQNFCSFPILSLCPRPNLLGPQACLFHWANPGSIPWRWPSGFWKVVFEDLRSQNMGLSENWVYSQWNSHLIGIMIINHWV